MSHTIFASFARDMHGTKIHKGDKVSWEGHSNCEVRAIKRGGNLELVCPGLPYSYGVKSNRTNILKGEVK